MMNYDDYKPKEDVYDLIRKRNSLVTTLVELGYDQDELIQMSLAELEEVYRNEWN